jgi:FkbM family methyltransferase
MIEAALRVHLDFLLWPGPRVVFEVGACEGEHTAGYARAFPRAKFYLFEPLPANCEKIEALLAKESWIPAEMLSIALSDEAGEAEFHISSSREAARTSEANKSSSLMPPRSERARALEWLDFNQSIRVKTDTIDAFCQWRNLEKIDFIHMDVQGAELKVLSGATRMLSRIRAIWMEVAFEKTYEGQPLEPETTRWMAERGYRKVHQISYGPEGDALYFNMRLPLSWPRFIALRLLQKVGVIER